MISTKKPRSCRILGFEFTVIILEILKEIDNSNLSAIKFYQNGFINMTVLVIFNVIQWFILVKELANKESRHVLQR